MLIDWFTVGAQALNFVILVWLLKRFLYQPVLDAIDAREARIAAALADAASTEARAHQERDEFQYKSVAFEQQRASLLEQATRDADAVRERLLDEARQAADALSAKRREAARDDAQRLGDALVRRAQQEVFSIARKTLADLAGSSLEERIVEAFARRLRDLNGPARECMARALADEPGPAVVRSAFELPDGQRAAIRAAVGASFPTAIALRFETSPELVSGVELSAGGQKLAWSIAEYLASLQKAVDDLTQAQAAARTDSR